MSGNCNAGKLFFRQPNIREWTVPILAGEDLQQLGFVICRLATFPSEALTQSQDRSLWRAYTLRPSRLRKLMMMMMMMMSILSHFWWLICMFHVTMFVVLLWPRATFNRDQEVSLYRWYPLLRDHLLIIITSVGSHSQPKSVGLVSRSVATWRCPTFVR